MQYARELITRHVSGRLKVAPENTQDNVLKFMRKPSFELFYEFKRLFDKINKEAGLRQQIIPYFISSHPGCSEEDMAELAVITKGLDFHLEQVQDFTPTPMTVSTTAFYTGYDPYTLEPLFCAKTPKEKLAQRMFFFWYKPEERQNIERELRRIGRTDLIAKLYDGMPYHGRAKYDSRAVGSSPEMPKRPRQQEDRRQEDRRQARGQRGRRDEQWQNRRDGQWQKPSQRETRHEGQKQKPKRSSFNPNFQPKSKNRR
jgi:hypothetical protein